MAAKSSNADLREFFELSQPKKRPCQIGFALSQLEGDERKKLEAAIAQSAGIITASAVMKWLKIRGLQVSIPAVTSHRHGTCTCTEE